MYTYKCDHCGHIEDDVFEKMVDDRMGWQGGLNGSCPSCADGRKDDGSWHRIPVRVHTDIVEFHTPIEMYSVAMETDDEIRAFKQRCPDVDVATNPEDPMYGIPIARNRKQKLAALGTAGFVETK